MDKRLKEIIYEFKKSDINSEAEIRSKLIVPLIEFLGYPSEFRAEEFPVYGHEGCKLIKAKNSDFLLFKNKEFAKHNKKQQEHINWVQDNSLLIFEAKNINEMPDELGQPVYYTMWTKAVAYLITDGVQIKGYYYKDCTSDREVINCTIDELPEKLEFKYFTYENLLTLKEKRLQSENNREKTFVEQLNYIRNKIKLLIEKFSLNTKELYATRNEINKLRYHSKNVDEWKEQSIDIAKKATVFIKQLSIEDLLFLSDTGVNLHIQIIEGLSQYYAEHLFYFLSMNINLVLTDAWRYELEQVERILTDCIRIVEFKFEEVSLSEGYVYKKINGKLLAASITGESYKVYVWNIEHEIREPVAVLGGLYEHVSHLKIIHNNNKVFVIGKGTRQIYVWDLTVCEHPIYIFKGKAGVSNYTVTKSLNGGLYVIGTFQGAIYIWDFYKSGEPIKYVNNKYNAEDIFIINSRLDESGVCYDLLGDSSSSSNTNGMILEIKENTELDFRIIHTSDEKSIIGATHSLEQLEYCVDSYRILPNKKIMGILTRKAIILYDIEKKEQLSINYIKGQQPMDFRMFEANNKLYLMVYYLWVESKDDKKGLIRCFVIKNNKFVEVKHYFRNQNDIAHGVVATLNDKITIFFNEYNRGTIYLAEFNNDKYYEFYKFPQTMRIVDIVCE